MSCAPLLTLAWLVLGAAPAAAQQAPTKTGEAQQQASGTRTSVKKTSAAPATDADDDADDDDDETMAGSKLPKLDLDAIKTPRSASMEFENPDDMNVAEFHDRPYPNDTYRGAEALKLDPDFVYAVQQGLEMIYLRDYSGAYDYFVKIEEKFPGTGVASVADILRWQALMLENFDFRFDKQYWVASKQARVDLDAALAKPGNEAWEHFLMAGVVGIEAIHTVRQTKYLSALQLAFSAMDHIEKSRAAAPAFTDIVLADGMYNYWRTVVTKSSSVLPDFGDKRAEGIQQMQEVETSGIFLRSPATLSLAFTWVEEGEYKQAISACIRNRQKYPRNIVNNLVTGQTYVYMKRFDSAFEVLGDILEEDPNNKRVRYWLGLAYLRSGDADKAEKEFVTYLAADHLEDWQRANALNRLGQVYKRKKEWGKAYESFVAADKAGHKGAKSAAEGLKKRKKEGKIDF